MVDQEEKGFKVVDHRAGAQEPESAATAPAAPAEGGEAPAGGEVQGPGWRMKEEKPAAEPKPLPPVDFTTFCLSLASSAMMHLGLVPYPESGQAEKNLPLAKQTIDILELLQTKTRGNLTPEEERLLSTVLYDLQMRFVEARR